MGTEDLYDYIDKYNVELDPRFNDILGRWVSRGPSQAPLPSVGHGVCVKNGSGNLFPPAFPPRQAFPQAMGALRAQREPALGEHRGPGLPGQAPAL